MKKSVLVRGASVFTAAVVSLGLSATSVSAGAPNNNPQPPKGGQHGDLIALIHQTANNSNRTNQSGSAAVDNHQKNLNKPITLFAVGSGSGASSCGCGGGSGSGWGSGGVKQGNQATNSATSNVVNGTGQWIGQHAAADAVSVGGWPGHPNWSKSGAGNSGPSKPGGGGNAAATVDQTAGNTNATDQSSTATVDNHQKNLNKPISIGTVDTGSGAVDQSNAATNTATSNVGNVTDQAIEQDGSAAAASEANHGGGGEPHSTSGGNPCGCTGGPKPGPTDDHGGDGHATVDQQAGNDNSTSQQSEATVDSDQRNINLPVTLFSVGSGNGDVDQGNSADNSATSNVGNGTDQWIGQDAVAGAGVRRRTWRRQRGHRPGGHQQQRHEPAKSGRRVEQPTQSQRPDHVVLGRLRQRRCQPGQYRRQQCRVERGQWHRSGR